MSKIEEKGRVSFGQSIKDFFKGYIDFSGRSTRAGYWWMQLVLWIAEFIISFGFVWAVFSHLSNYFEGIFYQSGVEECVSEIFNSGISVIVWMVIAVIFFFAFIIPTIALVVRRMRDAGLSTAGIVTFYIVFIALVLTDLFIDNGPIVHFFVVLFTLMNFVIKVLPSDCLNAKGNTRFEKFLFR